MLELEFRERWAVLAFTFDPFGTQQPKGGVRMDGISGNGGRGVFFDAVMEIFPIFCRCGTRYESGGNESSDLFYGGRRHLFFRTFYGGVWILEDIWKLTLQATLPHSLSQNAITGISVEGISQFTLGAHFGLKCSFEWSDTFASGQNYFCPQLTAVFNI